MVGAIEIKPQTRPEAKMVINNLRQHGIKHISIVSGDYEQPTKNLAEELKMDNYFHSILPENKAAIVEKLQQEGKTVCFVGDGVNDAIAMKKADVSISLSGATGVATDIAQIILMRGDLSNMYDLFILSKELETNLQQSLLIGLGTA